MRGQYKRTTIYSAGCNMGVFGGEAEFFRETEDIAPDFSQESREIDHN